MKTNSSTFFKTMKAIVIIFALICTTNMSAQNGPPPPPGLPQSDSIPLDGGIGILVLVAATFGIKKLRGYKN